MRLAAYLSASRHGIYYFRYPLPTANHPARKRGHVKVSLSTREPRRAGHLARLLAVAGQSLLSHPMVLAMRYDEMRKHVQEHFSQLLRDFRERTAADGPLTEAHLYALRAAQTQATGTVTDWLDLSRYEDETALVRSFCERRKPPANMTKADVQEVKAALFKLPKNRSKNPKTRDLPLREALEVTGLERIAARTMNVYLGHMQHFFGWAVDNGYAAVNVFQGLRLKRTARSDEEGRKALPSRTSFSQ